MGEAKVLVEIRSYQLSPRTGREFHNLVEQISVPMLREFGTNVVAYGSSVHDPDAYVLIRAYASLEDRTESQEAFYGSQAWKAGPREAILALIVSDIDVVMWLTRSAVENLRAASAQTAAPAQQ